MNWQIVGPIILAALVALNSVLTVVVAKWADAPKWLRVIQAGLADLIPLLPGVPGSQTLKAIRWVKPVIGSTLPLLLLAVGLGLNACATTGGPTGLTWSTPVIYAGPTVAPIEEVSRGSQPAVAGGFQLTAGLGQFEMLEREWDLLDPGVLVLGGLVGGAGPTGMLQIGGKLGTLNGIVGAGILFDCIDSVGNGACQGGRPGGPIYAGIFDIQALVAFFGTSTNSSDKIRPRIQRGGFGL